MATYTDNYQLTKPLYSEVADIATINNNMDKVDDIMHNSQISLADAYDQTQTYELGEKVMYEMLLYRCVSRITTPEVWNPAHWERTTAADEGGNYVDVDEKFPTGLDVADVDIDGDQHYIKVPYMTGATSQADGTGGLVPAPKAGDENKFFKGDGSWDDVPAGGSTVTITPETITEPKAKVADYSIDGVSGSIYAPIIQIDGKASGAVASFSDGSANPIKSIDIEIVPLQSGSGDPSPNNNRPISGWTGASLNINKKNMLDISQIFNDTSYYTKNSDGSVTVIQSNGKAWTNSDVEPYFIKKGTYTITRSNVNGSLYVRCSLDDYAANIANVSTASGTFTLSEDCYIKIKPNTGSSATFPNTTFINITAGTKSESYEPYYKDTYTITFEDSQGDPLTIYGGEIHIRRVNGVWSGEVIEDRDIYTATGSESWSVVGSGTQLRAFIEMPHNGTDGMCNIYKKGSAENVGEFDLASNYLRFNISGIATDSSSFNAWIQSLSSGLKVLYYLTTPNTYPIDPVNIPNIITLLGDNNMFADTGDIDEVVYFRDLNSTINLLWNAVFNQSNTRSLSMMKSVKSEDTDTKEVEEEIEEEETEKEIQKEGNDENQR